MKKDINISEVAKKAGVSIATVSRVFNNSGPVKESTRKLIEGIIEETGYQPNILARELAEKRTNLIGMIVHNLTGEGMARTIQGVSDILEEHAFNLLMTCSNGSFESEKKHFELLRLKRVDGILFATRNFTQEHKEIIEKLPIPVVVLLQDTEKMKIPCVTFANYSMAKDAAENLLKLGHRTFAYLDGPLNSVNARERKHGVMDALSSAGIDTSTIPVGTGNYHIESGYEGMEGILQTGKKFSAVIAVNDGMAIGAMNCLMDHGFAIPEDVSVLGLDDTVLAKASRLQLSGVHYSYTKLGDVGAALLLKQIQAESTFFEKKVIPYEVNLRQSVRSLK